VENLEKLDPKTAPSVQANRLTFKVGSYFLPISVEKNPIEPF
jgi:hypothetical protein